MPGYAGAEKSTAIPAGVYMHGKHEMEKADERAYNVPLKPAGTFFSLEDRLLEESKGKR